ncbi:hypothetical protein AB0395_01010 [Streptosporangium sp. NPDC051023]|uniref:hypothetical protein n=1 Tax=Streptosporangium sp. NPDC051023 TaxID=3155410 RepID=UPI00344E69B7
MKRLGPVHTLTAGAVMALALAALSVATSPAATDTRAQTASAPRSGAASVASTAPETASKTASEGPDPASAPTASTAPEATESAAPTPVRADYAGRVKGNGGLIAVSIREGKAIAYFCDGRVEAWLKGRAENGGVTLTGPHAASVTAVLRGGSALGRLEIGGREWNFTAPTVRRPSGLYRASAVVRGASVKAGWIYLDDGSRVGLTLVDGRPADVPIPPPGGKATVDGQPIVPRSVDEFMGEM